MGLLRHGKICVHGVVIYTSKLFNPVAGYKFIKPQLRVFFCPEYFYLWLMRPYRLVEFGEVYYLHV